ncbi:XRE family transcriptional regulator [Paenibacillus mesophilus]|uniref:XRE family transcriptional regulator n=1 Tax=Paenibacillus mesophilus TaxID=2582849 RepID=UPI00110F4164|nr:XRE family transcriptional regulator [Paenibacillus mesophilus]TMV52981.1 XRE family transcriptional regulator [Paenibacillus mesophilus]
MKYELGRCLLAERLQEAGMPLEGLALELRVRRERLVDCIDNKRVMSLKLAISIADTLQCDVRSLYELTLSDERR